MTVQSSVEDAIASNHILVYSKSYCGFSKRAKTLLTSIPNKRSEPKVYELDQMGEEGQQVQDYLLQRTGQRTVPNVFIAQKHIGGSDALMALHERGELEPLIALVRSRHFAAPDRPTSSPLMLCAGAMLLLAFVGFGIRSWRRRGLGVEPPKEKL